MSAAEKAFASFFGQGKPSKRKVDTADDEKCEHFLSTDPLCFGQQCDGQPDGLSSPAQCTDTEEVDCTSHLENLPPLFKVKAVVRSFHYSNLREICLVLSYDGTAIWSRKYGQYPEEVALEQMSNILRSALLSIRPILLKKEELTWRLDLARCQPKAPECGWNFDEIRTRQAYEDLLAKMLDVSNLLPPARNFVRNFMQDQGRLPSFQEMQEAVRDGRAQADWAWQTASRKRFYCDMMAQPG